MYCLYCGKKIDDVLNFCPFCGKRQDSIPTTNATQEPAQAPIPLASQGDGSTRSPSTVPVALLSTVTIVGGLGFGAWRLGVFKNVELPIIEVPSFVEELPFVGELFAQEDGAKDGRRDTSPFQERSDGDGLRDEDSNVDGIEDARDSDGDSGSGSESSSGDVAVRDDLADYSWRELAQIAEMIESCSRSSDALAIAQDYGLVDPDGRYGFETKEIITTNGDKLHMRLVGVWHDDADTPSGKAGLSFLSDGIVQTHKMGASETLQGGWESSLMRGWLSNEFWNTLPSDVSSCILPAYKSTNNSGEARSVSCVTQTIDRLWLPSVVELCGPVDWEYQSNPANSALYNSIINAEGTQYPAFAQEDLNDFSPNARLAYGGDWWLRSASPSKGKGRNVTSDGDPSLFAPANESKGVVVGFCL